MNFVMRERTTWDRNSIIASVKTAEDPRAMNQDHLQQQPPADKYLTGGPSEFAEDVHPSGNTWEAEYDASGTTERNAIGMPEMRGDTYNHPERTAALDENLVVKKADLCVSIARKMLGKTASEQSLEDQALSLMYLPDADLISTANRLAGVVTADDDDDEEEDEQSQQQQQQEQQQGQQQQGQKQAQQQEEKKQGQQQEEEKKQGQQQEEQQGQKQAQQQEEEKKQGQQQQEEQGQKQASLQQMAQSCVQAMQQGDLQAAQQQIVDMLQQATQQQAGQNQQYMAQQLQQMIQQAMQQGQQQPVQQQQAQQQQPVQEQAPPPSDDQLLAQMLAPEMAQQDQLQQGQMLMADDIQLDGPVMDVGETVLGSGDDILQTLFASDSQVVETPKSSPVRTASTRTVGTHPTQGVAKLGGGPSSSEGSDVDRLSSLWASAPDVSNVFRS